jgi:hypothetical protein
MPRRIRSSAGIALVCLCLSGRTGASAQSGPKDEPNLTDEQKMEFLLKAKVIDSKQSKEGVTHPWTLTLTDGTVTHKASFQPVDEHKSSWTSATGRTELNFVDSYHYNIAAYELARMLGLNDLIPPYVERKWNGQTGSLSWWVPWKWDEAMRHEQGLHPPDADAWNKQMYKVRVFDALIYDTDPNLTNVLITEDWKVWRIDFTRAFRGYKTVPKASDLVMCDRQLLQKLKELNFEDVYAKTRPHLSKGDVRSLLARRDVIVETFQKLVAQKGEGEVLY